MKLKELFVHPQEEKLWFASVFHIIIIPVGLETMFTEFYLLFQQVIELRQE